MRHCAIYFRPVTLQNSRFVGHPPVFLVFRNITLTIDLDGSGVHTVFNRVPLQWICRNAEFSSSQPRSRCGSNYVIYRTTVLPPTAQICAPLWPFGTLRLDWGLSPRLQGRFETTPRLRQPIFSRMSRCESQAGLQR